MGSPHSLSTPREFLQKYSSPKTCFGYVIFVDPRGVEPRPIPCHGIVLPLYYGPSFSFRNRLPAALLRYTSRFLASFKVSNSSVYATDISLIFDVVRVWPRLCCASLRDKSCVMPLYILPRLSFNTYTVYFICSMPPACTERYMRAGGTVPPLYYLSELVYQGGWALTHLLSKCRANNRLRLF